jgi:hypothetical protein
MSPSYNTEEIFIWNATNRHAIRASTAEIEPFAAHFCDAFDGA